MILIDLSVLWVLVEDLFLLIDLVTANREIQEKDYFATFAWSKSGLHGDQ